MKIPILSNAEGRFQPWRALWAVTVILGLVYTWYWTIFLSAFGGWDVSSFLFPLIWFVASFASYKIGVRISRAEHATRRQVLSIAYWFTLLIILYEIADDLVLIFLL